MMNTGRIVVPQNVVYVRLLYLFLSVDVRILLNDDDLLKEGASG
jgi:hypothetical protein